MLTITCDLVDLTDSDNVGWVVFTLQNFGSSVPCASVSPPAVLSSVSCKAMANSSGVVSQALIGNDQISPKNTNYLVSIFSNLGALISEGKYSFSGSGTVDLSTLVQIP
jgi:hypothetical protein